MKDQCDRILSFSLVRMWCDMGERDEKDEKKYVRTGPDNIICIVFLLMIFMSNNCVLMFQI